MIEIVLRTGAFLAGLFLATYTVFSAVETLVLPRGAPDRIAALVFHTMRALFTLRLRKLPAYVQRDRLMAFFAPFSVLALLPAWLALVMIGYTAMFWAVDAGPVYTAFRASGSSLLTLGFESAPGLHRSLLAFSEATIGLILVALLIAYLPTMYAAFSRREALVTLLEVRAGSPPTAVEMLLRYQRIHGLERLTIEWQTWENWFADLQESHISLSAIVFFRSPDPQHSWVTSAGAVLDAASLTLAAVDIPWDAQAALCIRAGYLALGSVAEFFDLPGVHDPHFPDDPISISRAEFESALDRMAEGNIPMKPDREQAWKDFGGWRVNYDRALLGLAALTLAPPAPWSSDRANMQDLPRHMRI